jgi:hypothetical protein
MPSKMMVSDRTAIKYGFSNGDEFRDMVSEVIHVGLKQPVIYEAFDNWLEEDMTKKGLLKILDRARRLNK